jgi:hypothetical protein
MAVGRGRSGGWVQGTHGGCGKIWLFFATNLRNYAPRNNQRAGT